jgi:hypothetical protein
MNGMAWPVFFDDTGANWSIYTALIKASERESFVGDPRHPVKVHHYNQRKLMMMMVVVVMMMMMDCPTLHARPVAVLQDFTPSLHNRGTHARAPPPFSENETTTTTTSGCPRCLPFSRRLHCESFPMASTSSMKSPSCPTT